MNARSDFLSVANVRRGKAFGRQSLASVLTVAMLGTGLGGCGGFQNRDDSADHELTVQQNGREPAHLSLPQLQQLPQVEVATPQSRGAKVQRGPTVRTVLMAAGAGHVESVRVEGRDHPQTLAAGELTGQLILCLTKRNTLKLTGTHLGTDRWVRDVTTLVVNP